MENILYEEISINKYKLKQTAKMHAEALFYANDELLPLISRDRSLLQLKQTAELPFIESPVIGMPDMHEGYGIPVGGIMASEKIVSAGCVGMDINCGVRLLRTNLNFEERIFDQRSLNEIINVIESAIPVGLGGQYKREHPGIKIEKVITEGARHLIDMGYGLEDDLLYCEEQGKIAGADPQTISKKAIERARKQIGTLGSGNHFLELQKISKIYEPEIAKTFGLYENSVCFMIHSGSRALGHQTCIDYTNTFFKKNKIKNPELVPNHNLATALIDSNEGQNYLAAMNGAINFAFANRQMMTYKFRQAFKKYLKKRNIKGKIELVYDIAHNSAKWEKHGEKNLLVHRKGATRALPKNHEDNPPAFRKNGHPAFVPGSMGTASYILVGTEKAHETFNSVNHGAGRAMSRSEAKRTISKRDFEKQMQEIAFNKPFRLIADEAPQAYKDINAVIDTLEEIGITKRVAKLEPLAVVKGD